MYPDEKLLDLLELSADIIESITQQFFGPRRLDLVLDGLGARSVEESKQNKIIEFVSLELLRSDGTTTTISSRLFSVLDRRVRLRPLDTNPYPPDRAFASGTHLTHHSIVPKGTDLLRFPFNDQNVRLVAVFGWMDLVTKFETTLGADLARGATTISLTDTDDLLQNDVLLIDGRFWVIVDALTTPSVPTPATPGLVAVDPVPDKALAGNPVIRFGQIPRLIRQAAIRTAIANQFIPGSEEETQLSLDSRIKREETDNYEIEFFPKGGSNRAGSPESGTGDPKADAILSRFRASSLTGAWV